MIFFMCITIFIHFCQEKKYLFLRQVYLDCPDVSPVAFQRFVLQWLVQVHFLQYCCCGTVLLDKTGQKYGLMLPVKSLRLVSFTSIMSSLSVAERTISILLLSLSINLMLLFVKFIKTPRLPAQHLHLCIQCR